MSSSKALRTVVLGAAAAAAVWAYLGQLSAASSSSTFVAGRVTVGLSASTRLVPAVVLNAAVASKAGGVPITDGDTVYIKVMTGRYIGDLDGTSKKEWVKARGTQKDKEHALKIERKSGPGGIQSGDIINIVLPNGIHMDVCGSAVRARFYDPKGEWQKIMIVKQGGGAITDGDKIFLKGMFSGGRDYLDANPLSKCPDGEINCRWSDEGDWQVMTIEK